MEPDRGTRCKDRKKLFHYKEVNVQPFSARSSTVQANCRKFSYLHAPWFGVPIAISQQRLLARKPRCKEGADLRTIYEICSKVPSCGGFDVVFGRDCQG